MTLWIMEGNLSRVQYATQLTVHKQCKEVQAVDETVPSVASPQLLPDHTYPTFAAATWNLHTESADREINCPWAIHTTVVNYSYAFPNTKLVQIT